MSFVLLRNKQQQQKRTSRVSHRFFLLINKKK